MKNINWNIEFDKHSLEDWKSKALKEVKNDESKLTTYDAIEEIKIPVFYHKDKTSSPIENPGDFPYTRGYNNGINSWTNGLVLDTNHEKKTNKKALEYLMNGIDFLYFNSSKKTIWKDLIREIELKHIHTQFNISSFYNSLDLINSLDKEDLNYIAINHDIISCNEIPLEIIEVLKEKPFKIFLANGYNLQQCGANTWQEIATILSSSHEMLVKLMKKGFTIDQAAACIHFSVGIGSNYFMEISKIRALRTLWSHVVKAYNAKEDQSYECHITAHIGLMNKSLKDPYTNILRQTTESMSAIIGGINHLLVHPYDEINQDGASNFATKVGTNISLLLKEESKFGISKDPLGGSYLIENLSHLINQKAWDLFQKLDTFKCIMSIKKQEFINDFVSKKAKQRVDQIMLKEKILIGINAYFNNENVSESNTKHTSYLGLKELNYESIYKLNG